MKTSRRDWMILSGAAALGSRLAAQPDSRPWHQRVRRVGQVNFNERDPQEADTEAWADYWASAKVDAVLVNVTGMLAFYPTEVPFHRRSRYLGTRDLFGDCCRAAKKRGIRVIARLSPDLQWEDVLAQRPEWFMRDREGKPVPVFSGAPGLYQTCMFTSYFSEFTPAVMREINARYDVDGHYANGWPNFNVPRCYCAACRAVGEPGTPAYHRRYMDRAIELWRLYDSIAKEKSPENLFFGNLGGGVNSGLDLHRLGQAAAWFNADNQGRTGASPQWGAAQQGRVAYAVMKGRTVTNVTAAWSTGSPMWRNAAKSAAEAETWMAQSAASGMAVWYHWLGAQTGLGEDRRWQETGRRFLQWHARHDRHFANRRSIATLAVVLAQRTQTFYQPPAEGGSGEEVQGFYSSLVENRIPFDFVHEDDLGPGTLSKYRALILPNAALLSDAQCRQLEDYAAAGGSLIATFETSLYDELGRPRPDFGLARLFGIAKAGPREGSRGFQNSFYARLEQKHPLTAGFSNTNWIAGAEWRQPVRAAGEPLMTVVPPYPAYPTEITYTETMRTTEPAAAARENGASRLVYFAGDVGRTYWRSGHPDPGQLLRNAIEWVLRGEWPVRVEGEGLLEMFAWETAPGFAVHLLNYNNPNFHRGMLRRHSPVGPQRVRMTLPAGVRVRRAELLSAGVPLRFRQQGAQLVFEVPRVDAYEVAAFET